MYILETYETALRNYPKDNDYWLRMLDEMWANKHGYDIPLKYTKQNLESGEIILNDPHGFYEEVYVDFATSPIYAQIETDSLKIDFSTIEEA